MGFGQRYQLQASNNMCYNLIRHNLICSHSLSLSSFFILRAKISHIFELRIFFFYRYQCQMMSLWCNCVHCDVVAMCKQQLSRRTRLQKRKHVPVKITIYTCTRKPNLRFCVSKSNILILSILLSVLMGETLHLSIRKSRFCTLFMFTVSILDTMPFANGFKKEKKTNFVWRRMRGTRHLTLFIRHKLYWFHRNATRAGHA